MKTIAELAEQDKRRRKVLDWLVAKDFVGDTRTTLMHAANAIGDCNAEDFTDMIELGLLTRDTFNLSRNIFNSYVSVTDTGLEVLGIDPEGYHLNVWRQAEDSITIELSTIQEEIDELEAKRAALEQKRDDLRKRRAALDADSA